MSGLDDQAVNENITSIIEQIKASQQNVLKAFEDHNIFVNNSLEKLQQIKTETKVEVVKVKDPLEELKKVRDEFNKDINKEPNFINFIKNSYIRYTEHTYENNPKNILRCGWIENLVFKNCENIKSITLHFQNARDELSFKYPLEENSIEYTINFGSPDTISIIGNKIYTSMLPINLLPYQHIYFTCEKIDETKPCTATMIYGYYNANISWMPCGTVNDTVVFTIQGKKLLTTKGICIPYENNDFLHNCDNINKIQGDYIGKIVDILSLYKDGKISTTFKEIFLKIFNECLQFKGECYHFNGKMFKEAILKVRDIRWLLLEMEKYPQFFGFTEDDLEVMKNNGASRDNIYLVKKFLKKDGDYEEYHSEEEGGGIKFQYHMTGGKLDGEYKIWHKNGTLYCQDYYKEGNKEGESKRWNHDGQLVFQGYYKDGKLEGESKGWDKDGHLLEHIIYDNEGKIVKLKRYHNCGVLDLEKTLIENDTYELTRYYEWDGKIQDQVIMVGNKWNGEYNSWWHNGNKCTKTTYKNDKLDGEWEYWSEDGTLKEKCFYKDGEKQV